MKKFNVEVNWHGAYNSDGWQIVNDEPIEAQNAQEADDMLDPGWLESCLSVINEDGEVVPVESAEYRIVEIV